MHQVWHRGGVCLEIHGCAARGAQGVWHYVWLAWVAWNPVGAWKKRYEASGDTLRCQYGEGPQLNWAVAVRLPLQ